LSKRRQDVCHRVVDAAPRVDVFIFVECPRVDDAMHRDILLGRFATARHVANFFAAAAKARRSISAIRSDSLELIID
jgi:hypothetical protein